MNRTLQWCIVGACVFVLGVAALCPMARAQDQTITFSATGDVPYSPSQVVEFQEQLVEHNLYSPSTFFMHVGDIFEGGEPCDDSSYALMANMLKGLAVPVFIIPGDNETIDCSSPTQGLDNWKKYFLNFEQNFCGAPYAERQSTNPENFAFTMNGVLFIGINMVGGNSPYQPNAAWVSEQFESKGAQVRAAVVFSHVEPNKSVKFSTPFRQAAAAFGKPILFLHGHGHSWSKGYPFPEQNILRVQVNNGGSEDPVEVTVTAAATMNPDSMFIFKRHPWSSEVVYNMPPCANAGPDQAVSFSSPTVLLQGQATDDGDPNPPGALTVAWSQVSGPGTVTFENANALSTTASFSVAGTYVLRLTANDGELQNSDELTIAVNSVIAHAESRTGGASGSTTVTTSENLTGVNGDLYLAAISSRPKKLVQSVTGLGLNWTLVKSICSGNSSTTGMDVWMAQGIPQSGTVTAAFASAPSTAVIAVSRYSGVAATNPIGNVIAGNTNGLNGACSGGVDGNSYSFNLATTANSSFVYGAVALKARTHTPGAGYIERVEFQHPHAINPVGVAIEDKSVASASTVTLDGSFNGPVDWALVALEIRPQFNLTVSTAGSGSVSFNPPGGSYSPGTVVTLTATPASGFGFSGWSGDLNGSNNPAAVTMDFHKNITATFAAVPIVYEESQTGGASGSTTVATSASLTGVSGHLYLAAISSRPKKLVQSVTGLGLNWTLVKSICSGQSTTGMDVWMAQGTPSSDGAVSAAFASAPSTAVIAVSRYSGVPQGGTNPIGSIIAGNTNGLDGACSNGVDGNSYSFDLTTTANNALIYGAVALKARTHAPGAGYIERVEYQYPHAVNPIGVAVEDKNVASAATVAVSGSFSGAVDWALVALEIKPQGAVPQQHTLTVNTVGSGSVALNPPGGIYDTGTVVTLTAIPQGGTSGFQFSGWSGDLGGATNPTTVTMNGDKNVTATFTEIPSGGSIVYMESQTGGASGSTTVTTSANLTGVSGDLYLAAISSRPKKLVQSVTGLGLNWTLVKSICSGNNSTTVMDVWMAQGTPSGDGAVTAMFASAPSTAVIAVSRYSGVAATNPIGNVIAGNTNGLNGACSGGVDGSSYSFDLTTTTNDAVVYGAVAIKARTHTPGAGYTERVEFQHPHAINPIGVAVEDKSVASVSTTTVSGSFSGPVDWALVALEIKPQSTMGKRSEMIASALPSAFQLEQNYPNPFSSEARSAAFGGGNPGTVINFSLPFSGKVNVNIYDTTGQLVHTLVDEERAAGRHALRWDGRNRSGATVAAGIYLYRIVVRGEDDRAVFDQTRRMIFLK